MEEAVFIPNPFIIKAYGYENPKSIIVNHWVTAEFGYEVFNSGNPFDRWIYISVKNQLVKATPECMDDKEVVKGYLSLF